MEEIQSKQILQYKIVKELVILALTATIATKFIHEEPARKPQRRSLSAATAVPRITRQTTGIARPSLRLAPSGKRKGVYAYLNQPRNMWG